MFRQPHANGEPVEPEPTMGIEPMTFPLPRERSATEPRRRAN